MDIKLLERMQGNQRENLNTKFNSIFTTVSKRKNKLFFFFFVAGERLECNEVAYRPEYKTKRIAFRQSFVGQCIEISNSFIRDYERVMEFAQWVGLSKI